MKRREHTYTTAITWTGNTGRGTADYQAYERSYTVSLKNKPDLLGSSDPAFRGDGTKYNPEEMLVMSIASCHLLWYLHLCAQAGITVLDYTDEAIGTMVETASGGGRFEKVVLHPQVVIAESAKIDLANALHQKANELCFIANSVNFEVVHNPSCHVG